MCCVDRYHTLDLQPHGIDVTVTLRWLLDGEEIPEILTESQIQQREIEHQVSTTFFRGDVLPRLSTAIDSLIVLLFGSQMEVRKELSAEREKNLQQMFAAIDRAEEENAGSLS